MEKDNTISFSACTSYLVSEFAEGINCSITSVTDEVFHELAKNKENYESYENKIASAIYDSDSEIIYFIKGLYGEEEEVDEGSGTWGYAKFYFSNEKELNDCKNEFETLIKETCEQIIKDENY